MATMYRLIDGQVEERRGIHPVDFGPYFNDGWSLSPPNIEKTPNAQEQSIRLRGQDEIETPQAQETETLDLAPIEARLAELQALAPDWRAMKAIAEGHGITRPADGWDAAVLPILVAEYGQSAAEESYTEPA